MDLKLQRIGAWFGIGMLTMSFISFMAVGGLIPPQSPTTNASDITQYLIDNKARITAGSVITMLGATLAIPWLAVICMRIRRAECGYGAVTFSQAVAQFFPKSRWSQ